MDDWSVIFGWDKCDAREWRRECVISNDWRCLPLSLHTTSQARPSLSLVFHFLIGGLVSSACAGLVFGSLTFTFPISRSIPWFTPIYFLASFKMGMEVILNHIWRKGWAMLVKHRVADRSRPKELERSASHYHPAAPLAFSNIISLQLVVQSHFSISHR